MKPPRTKDRGFSLPSKSALRACSPPQSSLPWPPHFHWKHNRGILECKTGGFTDGQASGDHSKMSDFLRPFQDFTKASLQNPFKRPHHGAQEDVHGAQIFGHPRKCFCSSEFLSLPPSEKI